jgi:cytochrome c5
MTIRFSALALLTATAVVSTLILSCADSKTDEEHVLDIAKVAPKPNAAMAQRSGESLEKIGRGYWLFQRKCLECHEARVPKDPTDKNWHPVMDGMAWNAGLAATEEDAVLSYLRAAVRR